MNQDEIKPALAELGISQAEFARLIGVTPRAVTLWLSGDRPFPGPVDGYLRLLRLLPANLRQLELSRLRTKGTKMRDGMYGITFKGNRGAGMGVLVFDNGRIFGADSDGAKYDGEYIYHENDNTASVRIKVTIPANVVSVLGVQHPYEWLIDVSTRMDVAATKGNLNVQTPIGNVSAQYVFLRALPEAA